MRTPRRAARIEQRRERVGDAPSARSASCTNSRRDLAPGDDVHQADVRDPDEPPRQRVRRSRSCDTRRPAGIRATAASSVVVPLLQSAASAARSSVNDAECTSGNGQRSGGIVDVRRGADDDLSAGSRRWSSRAVATNGSRCRAISCAAAPGKQREHAARSAPMPSARRAAGAIGQLARAVEQRMADERRIRRRARAAAPPRTAGSPPPSSPCAPASRCAPRRDAHTCGVM